MESFVSMTSFDIATKGFENININFKQNNNNKTLKLNPKDFRLQL